MTRVYGPTVVAPTFGTLGLPPGSKETGQRVDFRTDKFSTAIEAHGYRLAWTRASVCPCMPLNTQTQQANPGCELCQGAGYFYFGPTQKQDQSKIGELNEVQAATIDETNAFVLRGIMTSLSRSVAAFDKLGTWVDGRSAVTVNPDNRLGYLDRLVSLDGFAVYTEKLIAQDPLLPLGTHYRINGGVNLLCSASRRYQPNGDFTIKSGRIVWLDPDRAPAVGTQLSCHYVYNVTWLVTSQPHVVRSSNVAYKTNKPQTPEGNLFEMALQAEVQMEHLVGDNAAKTLLL
jgi:hypothetical protein